MLPQGQAPLAWTHPCGWLSVITLTTSCTSGIAHAEALLWNQTRLRPSSLPGCQTKVYACAIDIAAVATRLSEAKVYSRAFAIPLGSVCNCRGAWVVQFDDGLHHVGLTEAHSSTSRQDESQHPECREPLSELMHCHVQQQQVANCSVFLRVLTTVEDILYEIILSSLRSRFYTAESAAGGDVRNRAGLEQLGQSAAHYAPSQAGAKSQMSLSPSGV